MKRLVLVLVITMSLSGLARAQVTFSSGGSLTAWNGTPSYVSIPNASLSGASTGQGDATITGTYGLLAETFTPSSAFQLGSVNLLMGVNNITSPTYTLNLYDLGPAGTVSVSGTASYNPYAASPASILLLFSDSVTFAATTAGEVQGTFTLPAADQSSLKANEEYAFELLTPTADGAAGVTWFRNGGSPADPGGQMFSSGDGLNSASAGVRNTLNTNGQAGGAPRIGALALYSVVPEPATAILMVAGIPGFAWVIRRRKLIMTGVSQS
jgi:hypothetical protein